MTRTERREARRRRVFLYRGLIGVAVLLAAVVIGCAATPPATAGAEPEAYIPAVTPAPTPSPALEETAAGCLAKMLYGEARGCSTTEQAAVIWCVLNRVDNESGLWPDDIVGVVTQPSQFHGYNPDHPVLPELLALVEDVLARWHIEDECVGGVGRVLPKEYTYFSGDGKHNYFRTEWTGGATWDWSLASPYGA